LITNGLSDNTKKFHASKIDLITRMIDALTRKFGSIDNMFREITKLIHDKNETVENIKNHDKKMDHIQLQTLPSPMSSENW
jgi:archaellum component FlaC